MGEKFTVIVEQGEDGYLISEVVELLGCHTQAKTYDKLIERTKETISLFLEVQSTTKLEQSSRSSFSSFENNERPKLKNFDVWGGKESSIYFSSRSFAKGL